MFLKIWFRGVIAIVLHDGQKLRRNFELLTSCKLKYPSELFRKKSEQIIYCSVISDIMCLEVISFIYYTHRSRIRYLSKKIANFNEFFEIKNICKNSYKNSLNARVGVAFQWNSLLICIISNKPTTTTEEFDAFHGFMLIKI